MISKITPDDLAKHAKWLRGEDGGERIVTEMFADLSYADLRNANLRGADLSYVNLSGANLRYADLSHANLSNAKNIPDYAFAVTLIVPEGDLIVYKSLQDGKIAKLLVPKEAKRSNATGRKCRAEFAEVLAIESKDGKETLEEGVSQNDCNFIYRVGETVKPATPFDEDRWNECSTGIHFFLTRYEAENF